MACAVCGAVLLRRPVMASNVFALSWLVVGLLNPTDMFSSGCQLSFLCVALFLWGKRCWPPRNEDPLDQLVEENRPFWQRLLLKLVRLRKGTPLGSKAALLTWQRLLLQIAPSVGLSYAISLGMWLAVAPLVAQRYNTVAPIGLLLMPPLVVLTSVALLSGFLLLLTAMVCPPLAGPLAWATRWCLTACDGLVNLADRCPGGHWYVTDMPAWWLWGLYAVLLAVVMLECLRRYRRWFALAGLAWLCVGLLGGAAPRSSDELRCTFLAVGHGVCTVLETPDGRVLLYDAGTMGGPDVAQRQIAPFLWQRGIGRIDEVFLSHADLDHFNGLPALLDRFAVGQVSFSPRFSDKKTPGVEETLRALARHRVPLRTVWAEDRLTAGGVDIEVLHPPEHGTEQSENARCLVLRVRHAGHVVLLTGDLDGTGQQRLRSLPCAPLDVLMAPHHGSRTANGPDLAAWARPRFVVSCQGPPRSFVGKPEPYTPLGARYLDTWTHGAITVRSHATGLIVETFRSGERWVLRGGAEDVRQP